MFSLPYSRWFLLSMSGLLCVVSLSACRPQNETLPAESGTLPSQKDSRQPSAEPFNSTPGSLAQAHIRNEDGSLAYTLQYKSTGGKLLDASGQVATNLILESDGSIRLTDETNATVGYIVATEDGIQVESDKRAKVLFTYLAEEAGNATLVDANGREVYRLDATAEGLSVESGKDSRYEVAVMKGQGRIQSDEGVTLMTSDGEMTPVALAMFGFSQLSEAQRAGLAYALSRTEI